MASDAPDLPPGSPIQVNRGDERTTIWYPANPGGRAPNGLKAVSILLSLLFLGMGIQAFIAVVFRGQWDLSFILVGVALSVVVLYFVLLQPTIQVWLESQTLALDQNGLTIIKHAPFYRQEKTFALDDMQGIALKHPKRGYVSKIYPTIITISGNTIFFEAATQPECEWVVNYLKYLLK